jgi:hypothetical protein
MPPAARGEQSDASARAARFQLAAERALAGVDRAQILDDAEPTAVRLRTDGLREGSRYCDVGLLIEADIRESDRASSEGVARRECTRRSGYPSPKNRRRRASGLSALPLGEGRASVRGSVIARSMGASGNSEPKR